MNPKQKPGMDPNLKVIVILGVCFGVAIAIAGGKLLGLLTAVAATVAGMLATQPRKQVSDGRMVRCPGEGCGNWMEPTRRRCPACEHIDRKRRL